jgi:hypothetical protein
LVAKLVSPTATQPAADAAAPPADNLPPRDVTSAHSCLNAQKKPRPIAPGSWLPFPSSFEQEPSRPEKDIEQAEGGEEADQEYLKKLRSIHSFGDVEDISQGPEGLFRPEKRREAPIENDLVQQMVTVHEADVLLSEFRHMSKSFPFVIVPLNMTAEQLHAEKPMLFLAIITVASWRDHARQMSLDTIYRKELAHRTIIAPKRTLGLVQSVLVYLSWCVFWRRIEE